MRFRTQAVAYPYFVVALLLYGLQIVFGLLSTAKYLGPDPIMDFLPFDVSKAIHTNLLIVWVLTGFMGRHTGWFRRNRGRSSTARSWRTGRSGSGRLPASPRSSAICSAGPRETSCSSSRCP